MRTVSLCLLAMGCSTPPPTVVEGSLAYDGAPIALIDCWSGCIEEYPCGGDIADLHGPDIDSFTVSVTSSRMRLWDESDGTGGVYYDGDCVESHEETRYDPILGTEGVVTVCDREDNLDFGLCWSGASEFTHATAPGDIDGVYAVIEAELDCEADGHTLTGTLTCKVGDYAE